MSKAGAWFHRIIRAIRSLIRAFRTSGPGSHRTGPGRRSRPVRPNPWPRCVACHRRVAGLCVEGCGVCPSCCPGEHDDD